MLKAWMQKDSDKPLGAEKHLIAGTVGGKTVDCIQCMYIYVPITCGLLASLVLIIIYTSFH